MNGVIVDSAMLRPHTCAGCRGSTGPFLDTVVDLDLTGARLYLCMLCLRQYATTAGFASGARMDELANAKDTVDHVEAESAKREQQLREMRKTLKARDLSITELQALVETLEGEVKRRDHVLETIEHSARLIGASG